VAAPDAELRPALGLLRRPGRGGGSAHALRHRERPRGARQSALREGLEQLRPARERGLRPPRRRPHAAARRLGPLLRRLLAGLLRRPDPVGHVQPRRRLQRGRRLQLLARGRARAGRAGLFELERLRRLDRRPEVAHAVRPELQRQRAARARNARRAPARLRRLGGPQAVPLPRDQPGGSGDGRAPVSRLLLHQPVRVGRELQLQLVAGEPARLQLEGAQLDAQLQLGALDRHRLVWYFSWEIADTSGKGLLSGWSLNGIVTLASGMPFNVVYLYEDDYNGSGQFFGRPDVVGNPLSGTATPERFLDLQAFQAPCTPNDAGGCAG